MITCGSAVHRLAGVSTSRRLMQLLVVGGSLVFVLTFFVSLGGTSNETKRAFRMDEREFYFLTNGSNADLRVMSFNIWLSGASVTDGFQKILNHILNGETFDRMLQGLGSGWSGVFRGGSDYSDDGIFTRHKLHLDDSFSLTTSVGVKIELDGGRFVHVVGAHLAYADYGPYAANNRLATEASQIMAGETTPESYNRVQNIKQLVDNEKFQEWVFESDKVALFVCGDFNAPSHHDWTDERKHEHGGWTFEWPATQLLENTTGLIDSFRAKFPNPVTHPAHTWSTVQKFSSGWNYTIPEPQDRLDFVFHKHPQLEVLDAFVYGGNDPLSPIPFHKENTYPSDHFAMIIDFKFK
ncbi:Endo/exonuclease/phosphatase domain-containing protein [Aphelenchoides fujianensis]|nr:Endo/exonuclease/phosphatase domain-containing protein [Aphelenchoides fujianensis]